MLVSQQKRPGTYWSPTDRSPLGYSLDVSGQRFSVCSLECSQLFHKYFLSPPKFKDLHWALCIKCIRHDSSLQETQGLAEEWRRKCIQKFNNKAWTSKRYWKVHCVCVLFFNTSFFQVVFFFNLFVFGRAGSLLLSGLFYSWVFSLEQGPPSSFRARTSHCGGFSCCGARL